MKNRKKYFAIVSMLLLVLFIVSCKEKKDEPQPIKSKTELLTGKYQLTAATVDPAIQVPFLGISVTDLYGFTESCMKDDVIEFFSNGVVNMDEAATKCDPEDPQTQTDMWKFSAHEDSISFGKETDFFKVKMKIAQLDDKILVLEDTDKDNDGTHIYKWTFTKK